ncbi:arrestin domain-containing protein 2-like isoform X2 [Centruroides sculpturatus]|uniref:arrestin domain-containing protein 2-like isoform X2 n=2 Tax=Centruroides TaxID=6875 RepID=UPI000C6D5C88|nr:arrestin domain-containing protein 2-like isoform X2 [Centruroides sculpturatus]
METGFFFRRWFLQFFPPPFRCGSHVKQVSMDYIREFDIRLEKEMYYAGEILVGHVILDTVENFKLKAIRVLLRGKAHAEWKVVVSGDRRTVKDDQVFIDDRDVIWGKESSLPCSFEARPCTVRYYVKVTVDIPYASPPQGMKYFTIIGPHIDCMEEQYLRPLTGQDKRAVCCLCCKRGVVSVRSSLERSAYCCGESIRLKADIDNQSEENIFLRLKLVQYVEFFIDRGVLGINKEVNRTVLEYKGDAIHPHTRSKFDSSNSLVVPVMPPTLMGVCRLLQIYYFLKVWVELEKSGDDLHMNFPITIATCPFRIPNSNQQPKLEYEVCCEHVEGGMYIGPEFLLGQVYDGTLGMEEGETVVLYRPVYVCVRNRGNSQPSNAISRGNNEAGSSSRQEKTAGVSESRA